MTIQNTLQDGILRLTCKMADDRTSLQLTLSSAQVTLLDCDYRYFCCFSQNSPWELKVCKFDRISCEGNSYGVDIVAENSNFILRDHLSFRKGSLHIIRSWTALRDLEHAVFGTRIPLDLNDKEKITIPGVIYNDNPCADSSRLVPHLPAKPGDALVVEEHRLAIPG
ncbi:MAG: hypothetical protein J6Q65_03905, partial [Lentisphaeria bacterium]|nr:hypothetical protein [Lentisphaeria bacterium]